jgi:hypothetical protein
VGFIPCVQERFNIGINDILQTLGRKYMIVLTDVEKPFDKIPYSFMIKKKPPSKLGIELNFLNLKVIL